MNMKLEPVAEGTTLIGPSTSSEDAKKIREAPDGEMITMPENPWPEIIKETTRKFIREHSAGLIELMYGQTDTPLREELPEPTYLPKEK